MERWGWRAFLLSLCAIVAVVSAIDFFAIGYAGSVSPVGQWGNTVGAASEPYYLAIRSVDPGHATDIAGLRVGDLIDIRPVAPVKRFWLFGQPLTGRPVSVLVRRYTREFHATIVPQPITRLRLYLITPLWFGFTWIAVFAGIIAWRRSGDPQMRLLCLVLISYALWSATDQHYVSSDSAWTLALVSAVNTFGALAVAFWAACAGSFGAPRSRLRIAFQIACYALVTVCIVLGLARISGILTLWIDPTTFVSAIAAAPFLLACAAGLACALLALTATEGTERQRAIWSLLPAGLLIFFGFLGPSLQGIVTSYELAWGIYYLAGAINILIPIVLTYVALSRRLLDIGFVLNRAAVFAIVSTILIAAFMIVEWIASEWLSLNHTTSAVASMAVALLLGFSIRYVHTYTDRFVDNVFFHRRHEAEASLRRFAHEAAFITKRETLLERTLSTVKASTGAEPSILVFSDRTNIDDDDPALVALRAWRQPVDLMQTPGSALQGQFAFPMVVRGELIGALICGTRDDNDVYAPDESEALQALADGVGHALGHLDRSVGSGNGQLAGTIAELRAAIRDLRDLKTSAPR